jgi:two-component system, NtrC family, nitrogen regulation response regulator NtrX
MQSATKTTPGDILIIDDEPQIRELVAEVLIDEGYTVRSAANGIEALRAIMDTPPALLLVDLLMPGFSGRQVIAEARKIVPDLPIVLMTALPNEAKPVLKQYQIECVTKPFNLEKLLDCVARNVQPGA